MKERTAGGDQLPPLAGGRDAQAWTGEEARAAFRLIRFPESFEILADRFDTERHAVRESPRPSNAGDEIHGVAAGRQGLLKQGVPMQQPSVGGAAGGRAHEQDVDAVWLMEHAAARGD